MNENKPTYLRLSPELEAKIMRLKNQEKRPSKSNTIVSILERFFDNQERSKS